MPFGDVLLTGLALQLVLFLVAAYALYWIVRKAVAHGIRDARRAAARKAEPLPVDQDG